MGNFHIRFCNLAISNLEILPDPFSMNLARPRWQNDDSRSETRADDSKHRKIKFPQFCRAKGLARQVPLHHGLSALGAKHKT